MKKNNLFLKPTIRLYLTVATLFFCTSLYCQDSFNTAGATVISASHRMTFTTGEVINQYHGDSNYVLKNGVIQYQKKNTTSIISINNEEILIYPNPVDEYIYIETHDRNATSYQIFDLNGSLIREGDLGSMIPVSELVPSSYCLKILSEKKSFTKIFIKI